MQPLFGFRPETMRAILLASFVIVQISYVQPCSFDKVSCERLRSYCVKFGPKGTMKGSCFDSPQSICSTYDSYCKGNIPVVKPSPVVVQPTPVVKPGPRKFNEAFTPKPVKTKGLEEEPRTFPPNVRPPIHRGNNCVDLYRLRREALEATNKYRQKHSVNSLYYSSELENVAQEYADELVRAFTTASQVQHSGGEYGENINLIQGPPGYVSGVSGYKVVDVWYDESQNYDFDRSTWRDRSRKIGHFTQLVWKRSREVGHGFATNPDCSMMFIVANYFPRGNYINRLAENVMPPLY